MKKVHYLKQHQFQNALSSYQYLKRARKKVVTENHSASYGGAVLPHMLII